MIRFSAECRLFFFFFYSLILFDSLNADNFEASFPRVWEMCLRWMNERANDRVYFFLFFFSANEHERSFVFLTGQSKQTKITLQANYYADTKLKIRFFLFLIFFIIEIGSVRAKRARQLVRRIVFLSIIFSMNSAYYWRGLISSVRRSEICAMKTKFQWNEINRFKNFTSKL